MRTDKRSLTTLQDRRMGGDLIETFKVLSNRDSIDWVKPLNLGKKPVSEKTYIWTGIECAMKQSKHAVDSFS